MKPTTSSQITFWLLQTTGWCPVFVLMLLLFGDEYWTSHFSILFAITVVATSIVISLIMRYMYKTIMQRKVPVILRALSIIILSVLAALAVGQIHYALWTVIVNIWPKFSPLVTSQPIASISLFLIPTYLAWSCLYWLITRQIALTQAHQHNELLSLRIKEKQLAMLLSQLNPHFMFNTINNIRSLVRIDGEKARDMLSAFADIMRYQFATQSNAATSVEKELEFVEAYVALHQLQLGKRLNFNMEIAQEYLNAAIPKMAIQLLVENAIKHAFGSQGVTGDLTLTIGPFEQQKPDNWRITLTHPGRIIENKKTGIGLSNLRNRLAMFFDNAQLSLTTQNEQVIAQIDIQSK